MIALNKTLNTAGDGYWSQQQRAVNMTNMLLRVGGDGTYGELRVFFDSTWVPDMHGLIYTDSLWLTQFRQELVAMGFHELAAADVDYSEQGMQGDDYVSLDVFQKFMDDADRLGLSAKLAEDDS